MHMGHDDHQHGFCTIMCMPDHGHVDAHQDLHGVAMTHGEPEVPGVHPALERQDLAVRLGEQVPDDTGPNGWTALEVGKPFGNLHAAEGVALVKAGYGKAAFAPVNHRSSKGGSAMQAQLQSALPIVHEVVAGNAHEELAVADDAVLGFLGDGGKA